MEQLLGEEDAAGLRDGDGGGTDVLAEKTAEVAFADFETLGERGDIAVVEGSAFD
jgi:hypothetical protein